MVFWPSLLLHPNKKLRFSFHQSTYLEEMRNKGTTQRARNKCHFVHAKLKSPVFLATVPEQCKKQHTRKIHISTLQKPQTTIHLRASYLPGRSDKPQTFPGCQTSTRFLEADD